jgi:hypothetical protein
VMKSRRLIYSLGSRTRRGGSFDHLVGAAEQSSHATAALDERDEPRRPWSSIGLAPPWCRRSACGRMRIAQPGCQVLGGGLNCSESDGGPVWVKNGPSVPSALSPLYPPIADVMLQGRERQLRARSGLMHCNKQRLYSITSSARASRVGGTVRPSTLAVLRLCASSYLVGFCTGRSAGFSPFRMRST